MIETFNYLIEKMNNFFESARRFFNNLFEKLKNYILWIKNLMEIAMIKLLGVLGSMLHKVMKGYKSSNWNIHDYIVLLNVISMVLGYLAIFLF